MPPPNPTGPGDPLLPRPPADGSTQWRPPVRIQPSMRYPIGPPYDIGPELFPPGTQRPVVTPPYDYPPGMPRVLPGFIGFEPPVYLPGQPIPPGMPPAWNGGPSGSRPPFPWEPTMIDPSWNPDSNAAPKHIPNPKWNGTYGPPVGVDPVVPRPGFVVPNPSAGPDTVIMEIPIVKPPGVWSAIAGGTRFVLGIAGGVAAIASLFSEGDHYDAAKACLKSFLSKVGYSTEPEVAYLGTSEAERMAEAIRVASGNSDDTTDLLKQVIQKGCNAASFNPAQFNGNGICGPFVQNMVAAIMLCRCKKNPPDTTAVESAKAALIARVKNHQESDYEMRVEMQTKLDECEQGISRHCINSVNHIPNGQETTFCCDKWTNRKNLIEQKRYARTYIVTWADIIRNMERLPTPTCDNGISVTEATKYIEANNKAMDAAVAQFEQQRAEWNTYKASLNNMADIGCLANPPSND